MGFLRRLLSGDLRSAVAAEAAGNVDLAAERYGLAGDREGAVRMHLARAARAVDRGAEIAALRDAVHWAGNEPSLRRQAAGALGRALLAKATAEGIAVERDRERVREAAALLAAAGDHRAAGDALEKIGDLTAAAAAFSAGGLVERLEQALARDEAVSDRVRAEREAFAEYETHLRVGRRDDARADLQRALAAAASPGDYRRLLDQLEAALLTGGRLELRRRAKAAVIACAVPRLVLGRDALADLPLRTTGISRSHAVIEVGPAAGPGPRFTLRDDGSRNGTTLAGLPLAGAVPLVGAGTFGLGEDCRVDFVADGEPTILRLTVTGGLDRGTVLVAGGDGELLSLDAAGLACDVVFASGRPYLGRGQAGAAEFGGEPLGAGRVQLIRGDRLVIDGEPLEVAP